MKKTFVLSYLLLAAFIGSAEAKTIDAGAGSNQLAADPSAKFWNDLNSGIEWLLAFYFGTEEENQFLDLDNTSRDSSESPSTVKEYEVGVGEDLWFAYNTGGMNYTYSFITVNTVSTPKTQKPASTVKEPYVINNKPAGETYAFNDQPSSYVPPEIVISEGPEPIPLPPKFTIPPDTPNKPQKPGKDLPLPGPEEELPERVNSPAPVPEPATMVLFSAGMAGLAIGRARRNKTTGTEKRG